MIEDTERTPEPQEEPADQHQGPLDDDEDGRYLPRKDPRRIQAEHRRGHPFEERED